MMMKVFMHNTFYAFTRTGNTVLIIEITDNMPTDFIQNNKSIMNPGDRT